MLSIAQANIDKFRSMLETETDPTKRALLVRLVDEQTKELAQEKADAGDAHCKEKSV